MNPRPSSWGSMAPPALGSFLQHLSMVGFPSQFKSSDRGNSLPPNSSCSTLGQLWLERTLHFELQSVPLNSLPITKHVLPWRVFPWHSWVCEDVSPGPHAFSLPGQRFPILQIFYMWHGFRFPQQPSCLPLPCHLQTFLGLQAIQSLAILLTLPSPVISPNQFFSCLFLFSWPCSWQIDTGYKLTQLQ